MSKKNIIIVIVTAILMVLLITLGIIFSINNSPVPVDKDFSKVNLENVDKLMIVAHPDDDAIWGGKHLLEDGSSYLVVCITCGVKKERVEEFKEAMSITGSKYLMLGWPDKTNGEKDNWDTSREGIKSDLEQIISLKNWDMIVTHNPEGEYGHIHHKMTNVIVTDIADKSKLMYFGKYYKPSLIKDASASLPSITDEEYTAKYNLIDVYKSQHFVFDMFGHMFKYENWVSYEDWINEN